MLTTARIQQMVQSRTLSPQGAAELVLARRRYQRARKAALGGGWLGVLGLFVLVFIGSIFGLRSSRQ